MAVVSPTGAVTFCSLPLPGSSHTREQWLGFDSFVVVVVVSVERQIARQVALNLDFWSRIVILTAASDLKLV